MINDGPACPICKSKFNTTIYDNHIHLIKCNGCGIVFNNTYHSMEYEDNYFTVQYKELYGKTYIEDFENIYSNSLRRLNKLFKLFKGKKDPGNMRLIDIGSALGFFLKAAQDSGLKDISGIEISAFAAEYCEEKFQINVINSSFHDVKLNGMFDIITAWYFLEHCFDPYAIVKKIFNSLNPDGIFALSTPSCFGPLYIFKRNKWYKTHPEDHRIDFAPSSIKSYLKKAGFSKIIVNPGGIHPERLLSNNSFLYKPIKLAYSGFSRLFSFSDTMEIYALK